MTFAPVPPLVSIIIPAYNAEQWVSAALESASAQSWPQKEIIVVNDGSRDATLAIARQFEPRDVRVIDQQNRGAAGARNTGLRAARGEFVQFLDADDLLAPDKIAAQVTALQRAPPDGVATGQWGIFERSVDSARFNRETIWRDDSPVDWLVRSWTGGGMMQPAAWLVPRTVIGAAGDWDESLSLDDDGEFFSRVVLKSSGVHFVEQAQSFYRAHGGPRISASLGIRAWQSAFASCEKKQSALLALEDSVRTRHACALNFLRYAWEFYPEAGEWSRRAIDRARELDPTARPGGGGRREQIVARIAGWRIARRIHKSWLRRRH